MVVVLWVVVVVVALRWKAGSSITITVYFAVKSGWFFALDWVVRFTR